MASIIIDTISNDNIINYDNYKLDLQITGSVSGIPSGGTLYLDLNGKTINTTVQSDNTYTFTINNDYISQDTEMYVLELQDKTPYIVKVYSTTYSVETYKAFYVDLSTTVMSYTNFLNGSGSYVGLPQDGDEINAANVNVGSIQNRTDLLLLDEKIGDISTLVDQKSSSYVESSSNDLDNANSTIVNSISQLRIDIGNKNLLQTNSKVSLVSAINELQENMYKPSQALNLVAHYDFQTNGNYVLNGGTISYLETLSESSLPTEKELLTSTPYQLIRHSSNYQTTSTKYNKFSIVASKILIQGYEISLNKAYNLYFQDTMEDNQPKHTIQYEDDITAAKVGVDGSNNIYKILYLDSYFTGIYSLQSVEGTATYSNGFTFTTNGSSTQSLYLSLKSAIQTNLGVVYSTVKLTSIPSSLTVNGTSYPCTLDANGFGVVWTGSVPPSGYSCTISSLTYIGKYESDTVNTYCSITSGKDAIYIPAATNFSSVTVSFGRILPRYDRIYVGVEHTDYNSKNYNSSFSYSINDYVVFNGCEYKCIASCSNIEPTNTTYWKNLGTVYEGVSLQPFFVYLEGYNNTQGYPTIPDIKNNNYLPLCTILNVYGQKPVIKNEYVKAYKMTDLQKMQDTLNDSLYNISRLALVQNLSSADENVTKNLFAEPYFDNDLRDEELELTHSVSAKSAMINNGVLTSSVSFNTVNYNVTSDHPFLQLNTQEYQTVAEQPIYSRSVLINKYQVSSPRNINITVTPQSYNWFADEQINNYIEYSATLNGSSVSYSSVSDITSGATSSTRTTTSGLRTTTTTTTTTTTVSSSVTEDYRTEEISKLITTPLDVPEYTINIKAPNYSFNGGEQVRIQLGDLAEYYGLTNSSTVVVADYYGALNFSFVLGGSTKPIKSGDRVLRVEGVGVPGKGSSYISDSRGTSIVTQTPWLKIINNYDLVSRDVVRTTSTSSTSTTNWNWNGNGRGGNGGGGDPLAQTFVATETMYLDSIYFMVDAIDSSIDIENTENYVNQKILTNNALPENIDVYLYGTTAGYPDYEKIIATGVLPRGTIINQSSPTYSKVELFPKPKLESGKTYAFVVAAPYETKAIYRQTSASSWTVGVGENNTRLKLRAVKLGETYPNPGAKNTLYNSQGYISGVMLSSSNAMTWTAHQDQDLTFKITSSKFSSAAKTVNFNTVTNNLTNITDVLFAMGSNIPSNTYINTNVYYSTSSGGDITNNISVSNGEHKILTSKIPTLSKSYIKAVMGSYETPVNGLVSESPVLYKEAALYFGTVNETSVYCTQNIDLTDGVTFAENKQLRVYLDTLNVSDSNIGRLKVYYTTDVTIDSDSWVEMPVDSSYYSNTGEKRFLANAGDNAIEMGSYLRIKIVISTNLNSQTEINTRIGVKNLRVFTF